MGTITAVYRSELRSRTVSSKTVFACLTRICDTWAGEGVVPIDYCADKPMLPVEEVISFGRSHGIKIQLKTLTWFRLLVMIAYGPVVLWLDNGNTIIAYKKGAVGQDNLIVSDPLYQDGKCFILPRTTLEQVWKGGALVIEREQSGVMRVTTFLLWVLSIGGFLAGAFVMFRAFHELTRY